MKKEKIVLSILVVMMIFVLTTLVNAYTYFDKYVGQYVFPTTVLELTGGKLLYALGAGNNGELYSATYNNSGGPSTVNISQITNWTTESATVISFDSITNWPTSRGPGANIEVDPLGNIYIAYEGGGSLSFIHKYKNDLSLDSAFGTNGVVSTGNRYISLSLDTDGHLFAGKLTAGSNFDVFDATNGTLIGTPTTAFSNLRGVRVDVNNNNVYTLLSQFGVQTAYLLKWTGGSGSNPTTYTYTTIQLITPSDGGVRNTAGIRIDYFHNQLVFWGAETSDSIKIMDLSTDSVVESFNSDTVGGQTFVNAQSLAFSRQDDGILLVIGDSEALGGQNGRLVYYQAYTFPAISPAQRLVYLQPGQNMTFTATGGEGAFAWSSSDTTVGTINSTSGFFTALSIGSTYVNVIDGNNQSGTVSQALVIITPTSAPLLMETSKYGPIRSDLLWTWKE